MTVAILTIGDEICIGQIVNTNAAWMAHQCSLAGFRVVAHSSVGDDLHGILDEFDRLLRIADVLLITGGLGPTHDDRTKTALVEFFDDVPTLHEPTLVHLHDLMRRRNRELNERTAAQALLPTLCEPLTNEHGTAPALWFAHGFPDNYADKPRIIVAMPGVPHEMKYLMENRILPRLRSLVRDDETTTLFTTLLTTGIAESALADVVGNVDELMEGQELAFLPSSSGVRLRISVTEPSRSKAQEVLVRLERKLRSRVERYVYGSNDDSLELVVGRLLKAQGKTLAVAESCTGGLLGAALTNVSGSSAYFLGGIQCYSNDAKIKVVGVQPATLAAHGAVSREVVSELASGVRERFEADFGVSITGVAGPDGGTPEKPVGTVWIALADANGCTAERFTFANDRTINRERSVAAALSMLQKHLMGL